MGGGCIRGWGLDTYGAAAYKQIQELQTVLELWTNPTSEMLFLSLLGR